MATTLPATRPPPPGSDHLLTVVYGVTPAAAPPKDVQATAREATLTEAAMRAEARDAAELAFLRLHVDLLGDGAVDRARSGLRAAREGWAALPQAARVVIGGVLILGFFLALPVVAVTAYRVLHSRAAVVRVLLLVFLGGAALLGVALSGML